MIRIFAVALLCMLLAVSCVKPKTGNVGEVSGYVPVYVPEAQAKAISFSTAQPTVNAGKILVIGTKLYQVETGTGVHVIDISNPATPVKKGFISVPGCQELSAKGSELYVNNYNDLVVLNANTSGTVTTVTVLKRITDAFPAALNSLPSGGNVYFECPDPSKGYIAGWTRAMLVNPKCRR